MKKDKKSRESIEFSDMGKNRSNLEPEKLLTRLKHQINKPSKMLLIQKPGEHSSSVDSLEKSIKYIEDTAVKNLRVKGSPENMLRTAIYFIRSDLNKRVLIKNAEGDTKLDPPVVHARDAMEKLDRLFRLAMKYKSLPIVSDKLTKLFTAQVEEIKKNNLLEPCKNEEAQDVNENNSPNKRNSMR
ncbi:MAG: hypothetical protein M3R00_00820 [Pseudomonadota bacterium]|nr:hypothetical protein [Pseudomonadota bacterium]